MTEHKPLVEIAVLGPLIVRVGGNEQTLRAPKQRLLLGRLVIEAGGVTSTDALIDALWGEEPPTTASKNLQVLIGRLRSTLGASAVVTAPGGYRLDLDGSRIDALEFERLVATGVEQARHENRTAAMEHLERAIALWRGDVAQDIAGPWGRARIARWNELRQFARERLLHLQVHADPSLERIAEVKALVEQHPGRESSHVLLITALRLLDDLAGARDALQHAVLVLSESYGLSPGRELQQLLVEFGIDTDGVTDAARRIEPDFTRAIAAMDERLTVGEILAALVDSTRSPAQVLDDLELLVDRGEMVREIQSDGRVVLVRVTASADPDGDR